MITRKLFSRAFILLSFWAGLVGAVGSAVIVGATPASASTTTLTTLTGADVNSGSSSNDATLGVSVGDSLNLDACTTYGSQDTPVPGGTVTFGDASNYVAVDVSRNPETNGCSEISVKWNLQPVSDVITATWNPGSGYATSSATLMIVAPTQTATTLSVVDNTTGRNATGSSSITLNYGDSVTVKSCTVVSGTGKVIPGNHTYSVTDTAGSFAFSGISPGTSPAPTYPAGCIDETLSWATTGTDVLTGHWGGVTVSGYDYSSSSSSGISVNGNEVGTAISSMTMQPSTVQYGGTTAVQATISPVPDGGTVSFTDADGFIAGCNSQPVNTSTGSATCTTSSMTTIGSDSVSATFSGYGIYGASPTSHSSVDVTPQSSSVAISAPTATTGQSVTITATVDGSNGSPVNSVGTVTFSDQLGIVTCSGVAVSSAGVASCTTAPLSSSGTDTVTATFSGATDYLGSSSSTGLTINRGVISLTISQQGGTAIVGSSVTISAVLGSDPFTSGTGTGATISLGDSGGYLNSCSALVIQDNAGVYESTCTSTVIGSATSDTITATFSGNSAFSPQTASMVMSISKGTAAVEVAHAPTSPTYGETTTITATVTGNGSSLNDGTVTFSDNHGYVPNGCTSVPVSNGKATCQTSTFSSVLSDIVSVSYSGDSSFDGGTTQDVVVVVEATPQVTAFASPTSPAYGETGTITATIIGNGSSLNDGTVTFSDNHGFVGGCNAVAVTAGAAICETTALNQVGADSITYGFSGDADFSSAFGSTDMTVGQASTSVAITTTSIPLPTVFGTTNVVVTVSPVPDGGTVNFTDGSGYVACQSVSVNTLNGVAVCPTSTLSEIGNDALSATFSGDTNFQSSSSTASMTINPVATSTAVSLAPNPPVVGQNETVTALVSTSSDSPATSGNMAFSDGDGYVHGCGAVGINSTTGIATCSFVPTSAGESDTVVANYGGAADYGTSTGSITMTPGEISTSTVLSASPSVSLVGQSISFTASISPAPDAGSVAFYEGTNSSAGLIPGCSAQPISGTTATCITSSPSVPGVAAEYWASYSGDSNYSTSSGNSYVTSNEDTTFVSSPSMTVTEGSAQSVQLATAGYPVARAISFSGSLPSGMTATNNGNGTATISGTPAGGSGGIYKLALAASNGVTTRAIQSFQLVVDEAPALQTGSTPIFSTDAITNFNIDTTSGYPAPAMSESGSLPSGLSFVDNGNGTATISGTPAGVSTGTFPITVSANNGVGAASSEVFTVVVSSPNVTGSTQSLTATSPGPSSVVPQTVLDVVDAGRKAEIVSSARAPKIKAVKLNAVYNPLSSRSDLVEAGDKSLDGVELGPSSRFPALGNEGINAEGDCSIVAVSNIVRFDKIRHSQIKVPRASTAKAFSAWRLLNGGGNAGVSDDTLLSAWRSKGVIGTKITGWHSITTTSDAEVKDAIKNVGAVYATVVVPVNSSSLGLVWTSEPSASTSISGHVVSLIGWNGQGFIAATWGEVVLIPYSWWNLNSVTAYAVTVSTSR